MAKVNKQLYVVIGYIAMAILALAISCTSLSVWAKPYAATHNNTRPHVIASEAKKVFVESNQVDTLAINAAFLKKMRENGELLSSDEFASRITSYYDTLVAVLTGLFVLFTLVTYITFKSRFENKFEDKARDLEKNQRQKIVDELRGMLSDSKKIDEIIKSAVGGSIDDAIATKEEVDDLSFSVESCGKNLLSISSSLEDIKIKQRELFKVVSDLQEQVADSVSVCPNEEIDCECREEDAQNELTEADETSKSGQNTSE